MTDLRQRHYRFRTDALAVDGAPTWGAAEDVDYDPNGNNFRLRIGVSNALATATGSIPWQIYASKNGGAYAAVTTASAGGVQSIDAGASADDAAILTPRLTGLDRPAWVLEGAAVDLDFVNGRYYGGSLADVLSISRASDGCAKKADGTLEYFTSNQLRITDLGLLIEDSRTNECLDSQDFVGTGNWIVFNYNALDNQTTAPDGTTTGGKITATVNAGGNVNSGSFHTNNYTWSLSANEKFVASAFLKAGVGQIKMTVNDRTHFVNCYFNLSNGTVGSSSTTGDGVFDGASIEAFADGWYRCKLNGHITSAVSALLDFVHDAINDFSYIWGVQFERAEFASSYIPTGAASAARAADNVPTIGSLNSMFGVLPNSVLLDVRIAVGESGYKSLFGEVGVVVLLERRNNDTYIGVGAPAPVLEVQLGNGLTFSGGAKVALAQSASGRSIVGGGGTVNTDANTGTTCSPYLGVNSGIITFMTCRRLVAWSSKLADATLQSLTAP